MFESTLDISCDAFVGSVEMPRKTLDIVGSPSMNQTCNCTGISNCGSCTCQSCAGGC